MLSFLRSGLIPFKKSIEYSSGDTPGENGTSRIASNFLFCLSEPTTNCSDPVSME